ncbi:XPB/Ssl2-like helicase family protein [Streptomyces sp. 3211.6]|uniref:helicase-associated domain-containing protein n=1 Tax=Streptomyces sp. 3211.6 TaxID=1938845 RepID=UPI000EB56D9B|nr:helicase-associated domain-containing protein [Streptomyces sp. 3211.6]RKT06905.1 XPB/Ssl2-like helicase family protein [Streptomyces sp. 3211.6]
MNVRDALAQWLGSLDTERLTALLEERGLPLAAGFRRITTLAELAGHLLGDESVGWGLMAGTAGELELLAAVAALALERHGPAGGDAEDGPRYPWQQSVPVVPVDPARRWVAEEDVLSWFEPGPERLRAERTLARLRERALLLPAPKGRLVLPPLLHVRAAGFDGYGRTAARLLTAAYNAPEVKRIAAVLAGDGQGAARTRDTAQELITTVLADPARVRDLVATAPARARELLDHLVPGPPLLRTHCFVSRYGEHDVPGAKFVFRQGGSGDEGTDWLAARGMLVPVGVDLVELPYEVARALRDEQAPPSPCLEADPFTATAPLPPGWADEGTAAAAAAAWRAEQVLRALAAQPVTIRKTGGIAVRDTRRLAKTAGADEADTRLWLDLAVTAGLAARRDEEPPPAAPARRRNAAPPRPPARLLPSDRYDAWAAAPAAGKLLPLLAAWAVLPGILSHWPDPGEVPVALVSPQDQEAVDLRTGVLRALATLPAGHGLRGDALGYAELLDRAAWFRPMLRAHLAVDDSGAPADLDGFLDRMEATLKEAALLGVVAHGALTPVGRALCRLLEAGGAHHYPAVPGAGADPSATGTDGLGQDLSTRPALAAAVTALREALHSALPAPSTTARFQSDLTATVTGAPAPALAELLSAVGDIESEGHAVVWRITAASVRRALDAGWSADDLLGLLTAASETPLPQVLTYTVKDAARTHGRLKVVRSACCIRSDDPGLIAEVAQARGLARLRLRRIAPTVLISTAPPEETLAALRTAGYAPTQEAETGTTVLDRAPAERAPSTLPTLDDPHPAYGHPTDGIPASARTLAAALMGQGR